MEAPKRLDGRVIIHFVSQDYRLMGGSLCLVADSCDRIMVRTKKILPFFNADFTRLFLCGVL